MPLTVAVQMDPIARIRIAGDSTFALLLEAQARGHKLLHYTPDRLRPWTYRPPLVVTELHVGGQRLPPAAALTLPAQAHSISVEFAALDYSAPARNRYAYRLEGYDDGWIETDATHRLASYAKLAPGAPQLHGVAAPRQNIYRVLEHWQQLALVAGSSTASSAHSKAGQLAAPRALAHLPVDRKARLSR